MLARLNFTGKEILSGKVFDTTIESVAKTAGIYDQKKQYRAATIMIGKNEIFQALEEEVKKMKPGEEKKIALKPEQAFGIRKEELIGLVPLNEFRSRKVEPKAGLIIQVDDRYGKVQSVSGGRVRVDFNPELAGKEIEYLIKLEEKIDQPEKIAKALIERFGSGLENQIKVEGNEIIITIKASKSNQQMAQFSIAKNLIAEELKASGLTKVKFIEDY